jgi:hypothetical protein
MYFQMRIARTSEQRKDCLLESQNLLSLSIEDQVESNVWVFKFNFLNV